MPINRLMTRSALPRIAQLRKGAPKPDANRPGEDLDHFRFVPDDDRDTELLDAFVAACGEEPRAIEVFLPYATVDENFDAWMEAWGSGSLKRRCNGETQTLWQDTRTQRYSDTPQPCACTSLPDGHPNRCRATGKLKVVIPALQRMAYVEVVTSSVWDIINLHAQLSGVVAMRDSLRGVPFLLQRTPREISRPNGKGSRTRITKHLLSIEVHPRFVQNQLAALEQAALYGVPALPAPIPVLSAPEGSQIVDVEVDPETGEVFDDDESAE